MRAGRRTSDENKRVPAAESHRTSKDGSCERHQQIERAGQEQHLPSARGRAWRLHAAVWQKTWRRYCIL